MKILSFKYNFINLQTLLLEREKKYLLNFPVELLPQRRFVSKPNQRWSMRISADFHS